MPLNLPNTTEQIEAIYASGLAATVAFVQHLVEQVVTQQETIERLTQRIAELEERLGRNSRNSNQPPSTDGFLRPSRPSPPRSQRQPSGKKTGGQPGHKGHTLRFSANPDRIVIHRPEQCAQCGC